MLQLRVCCPSRLQRGAEFERQGYCLTAYGLGCTGSCRCSARDKLSRFIGEYLTRDHVEDVPSDTPFAQAGGWLAIASLGWYLLDSPYKSIRASLKLGVKPF